MGDGISSETARFVAQVLTATKKGVLAWEPTAQPEAFVSVLDDDHSLRLERVTRYSDDEYQRAQEEALGVDSSGHELHRDHFLELYKGPSLVYRVQENDIGGETARDLIYSRGLAAYGQALPELWRQASLQTAKVSEELVIVNKFLHERLQDRERHAN
jgi:hypothetical protein